MVKLALSLWLKVQFDHGKTELQPDLAGALITPHYNDMSLKK